MFTQACLPIFTHIYLCLPMLTLVYICLSRSTRVYLCLPTRTINYLHQFLLVLVPRTESSTGTNVFQLENYN